MYRLRIILFLVLLIFCACTSQKKLIYFQGAIPQLSNDSVYTVRIYQGDILSINIFTINTEAYPYLSQNDENPGSDNRSSYERGYVVNQSGEVKLPLAGIINLKGLTISEATALIEQKFREFIDEPIVTVKKLNFKITILGEVNRPGVYPVLDEKITLTDILGRAGDLTQFGDREKLRIIREENGVRKDFFVNLTDAKSLSPSSYYLHPDDIIYVQPLPRRAFQNSSPTVTLFTSLITSTIVVLTFIAVSSR